MQAVSDKALCKEMENEGSGKCAPAASTGSFAPRRCLPALFAQDNGFVGEGMKGDVSVKWFVKKLHGLFEKINKRRNERGGTVIVK